MIWPLFVRTLIAGRRFGSETENCVRLPFMALVHGAGRLGGWFEAGQETRTLEKGPLLRVKSCANVEGNDCEDLAKMRLDR